MEVLVGFPIYDAGGAGGPTLHQKYTTAEAVAAFQPTAIVELLYDRQLIVIETAALCMATVGDPATQTHLSGASRVVWKSDMNKELSLPQRWYVHDKITGFPVPDHQRIKEHHVFLRLPDDEKFLYAGKAHMGSYSAAEANFTLKERLPRDEWLRLGGFPGWLIDVDHRSERVDEGDLAAFRRLAGEMEGLEFSHLSMTRFEEDVLTVHTNGRRGWLMYQLDPADIFYSGCDPTFSGDGQAEELFRCVCGIQMDCPADHTVPKEMAIRVAEEFFTTGALPRTLRWL